MMRALQRGGNAEPCPQNACRQSVSREGFDDLREVLMSSDRIGLEPGRFLFTAEQVDRRRENFDRHAAYVVVAFVAGA